MILMLKQYVKYLLRMSRNTLGKITVKCFQLGMQGQCVKSLVIDGTVTTQPLGVLGKCFINFQCAEQPGYYVGRGRTVSQES